MLHAVIMAGGSGTRFWPESRQAFPKQLLRLAGERSLLQMAVDRCTPWIARQNTWIVTNQRLATSTAEQLPEIPADNVLLEPIGRNTAPCIGLAAIHLLHRDPNAVMLVTPADHVISPDGLFRQAVETAAALVHEKPTATVLFGIEPTYPATGFGYIERGETVAEHLYNVARFREKPSLDVATEFVQSGRFYWNSGIFLFRADHLLTMLTKFQPEMTERLKSMAGKLGSTESAATIAAEFPQMKSISIDHGVMEHADNIFVLRAPFKWDDVGSWEALPRLMGTNADGNTVSARYCGIQTRGCTIRSTEPSHVIATLGLTDCIVVHTANATLVARKDDESAIRQLYAALEQAGFADVL